MTPQRRERSESSDAPPVVLDAAYNGVFLRAGLARLTLCLFVACLCFSGTLAGLTSFTAAPAGTSLLIAFAAVAIAALASYRLDMLRIQHRLDVFEGNTDELARTATLMNLVNPIWHGAAVRRIAIAMARIRPGMVMRIHPKTDPPRDLPPFPHRLEPLRLADVERLDDPLPPRSRSSGLTHGRIMMLLFAGTAGMLTALFLTPAALRPAALPFVLIGLLGYVPLLHWLGQLTTVQVVNQSVVQPMRGRWRAFERASSAMLMYHTPWSQWWYVTIADDHGVFQVQLRTGSAEALLRAWLSPLEPVPIERWTDYS